MSKRTNSKNHTHKYKNIDGTWVCELEGCTHYLPKNFHRGIPLGMKSICHECGLEFIIDSANLRQVHPKCEDCDFENPIRMMGHYSTSKV